MPVVWDIVVATCFVPLRCRISLLCEPHSLSLAVISQCQCSASDLWLQCADKEAAATETLQTPESICRELAAMKTLGNTGVDCMQRTCACAFISIYGEDHAQAQNISRESIAKSYVIDDSLLPLVWLSVQEYLTDQSRNHDSDPFQSLRDHIKHSNAYCLCTW